MPSLRRLILSFVLACAFVSNASASPTPTGATTVTVQMQTNKGLIVLETGIAAKAPIYRCQLSGIRPRRLL